jgi:hypothetical protein
MEPGASTEVTDLERTTQRAPTFLRTSLLPIHAIGLSINVVTAELNYHRWPEDSSGSYGDSRHLWAPIAARDSIRHIEPRRGSPVPQVELPSSLQALARLVAYQIVGH